jgi:hypothetical protein
MKSGWLVDKVLLIVCDAVNEFVLGWTMNFCCVLCEMMEGEVSNDKQIIRNCLLRYYEEKE